MSKALVNALTLALMESQLADMLVIDAKAFATRFVEENADLLTTQVVVTPTQVERRPGGPTVVTGTAQEEVVADPVTGELPRAVKHYVPVQGPDGLTDKQRAAIGGVGLCSNCQQPKNSHLPGCSVASGYDVKARTKDPLPPVQ
jgi:hypothetical protein